MKIDQDQFIQQAFQWLEQTGILFEGAYPADNEIYNETDKLNIISLAKLLKNIHQQGTEIAMENCGKTLRINPFDEE